MDKHDLYELCVQSPTDLIAFLAALHGGGPRVLHEDFCGTALLARRWAERGFEFRAVACDRDEEVLARARGASERIEIVHGDVRARRASDGPPADLVIAGNFSLGELRTRPELLDYLDGARARLAPRGLFVGDTYGGASAHRVGALERRHPAPDGSVVHHVFEQRAADPRTGEVVVALHFRVVRHGVVVDAVRDAFVYHWRVWSLPELRDALREVGFAAIDFHVRITDENGDPHVAAVRSPGELEESFVACVVARRGDGA